MLEHVPAAVGRALSGVRPGLEKLASADEGLAAAEILGVTSEAFSHEQMIPVRFTADGAKVSPPLAFAGVPPRAASLVLIVEDADSPTPTPFCHLLAWNIAPETGGFQEASLDGDAMPTARSGAIFGKNSFLASGWLPLDPPTAHGPHRYAFQLFALDRTLDLAEGAGRGALLAAMRGHVVAKGLLVGLYERPA